MENFTPKKEFSKEEARMQINLYMHEANVMGGNDSEIPDMIRILKDLDEDSIKPGEAVEKAAIILGRKNPYH